MRFLAQLPIQCHLWPVSTMDSIKLALLPLVDLLYFSSAFEMFLEQKYLGKESDQVSYSLCCSDRVKEKGQEITGKKTV